MLAVRSLGDVAPAGIQWPGDATYVAAIGQALGQLQPVVNQSIPDGGILTPPMQVQAAGLKATVEAATGLQLSSIINLSSNVVALANAADTAGAVAALKDAVAGTLEIATAAMEKLGAAQGAIDTMGAVGSAVNALFVVGGFVADSQAQYLKAAQECQQRVDAEYDAKCQQWVNQASPTSTSMAGVVQPADLFRPVAYAYQKGGPLPLSVASMFVALCGGETQGFGPITRPIWSQLVESRRKQAGKAHIGVSAATQRRMWQLIKGIMAAIRPPTGIAATGDGGRALMSLLLDIVANEWAAGTSQPYLHHGFDYELAKLLSNRVGGQYRKYIECKDLTAGEFGAGAVPAGSTSCGLRVDLAKPFVQLVSGFHANLRGIFFDSATQSWNVYPAQTSRRPAKGMLVLSPSIAVTLKDAAAEAKSGILQAEQRRKGLIAASILLAGTMSFFGLRYLAKR